MRRLKLTYLTAVLASIALSPISSAQTFTSVQSGNWEDGATWGNVSPGTNGVDYPTNNDLVIISTGDTVIHTNTEVVSYVEIEAGAQLVSAAQFRVTGTYHNDGVHSGNGSVRLQGNNDTLRGNGLISTSVAFRVNTGCVIPPGSNITRSGSSLRSPNNDTLLNLGTLTLLDVSMSGNGTSTFINGANAILYVDRNLLTNGTVVVSATGNEVHYSRSGNGNQNIKSSFDGYYDLYIEGTSTNSQKRLISDDSVLNDLRVEGARFLPMDSFALTIKGDLIFSGGQFDVVTNQADVILSGSGAQSIQGQVEFDDLYINKSGGTATFIGDTSSVRSGLFVQSGTLNANGLLRMISDNSGDARIAPVTGTITGDVIVERYIDAGATGWRFLSAPVSGETFEQWYDDFITSGFPGTHYPNFNFNSIRKYDESVAGHQDNGFYAPTSMSEDIDPAEGHWVWCGDGHSSTQAFTIDVVGQVVTGNVNMPVSYTLTSGGSTADGWSLVANPYVSPIDWDSPNWTKIFVDDAVYVWNTDLGQYASYIAGVGTNGGSNIIAPSQGFYVKANFLLPSLQATEGVKTSTASSFLEIGNDPDPLVRLNLSMGAFKEESVIRMNGHATRDFDASLDAYYLGYESYPVQLYTSTNDSIQYSINSVSGEFIDTVQLLMHSDEKFLEFSYSLNEQAMDYCVGLWDSKASELTLLLNHEDAFQLDNGDLDPRRYSIIIYAPLLGIEAPCYFEAPQDTTDVVGITSDIANSTPFLSGSTIVLPIEVAPGTQYTLRGIDGRTVHSGSTHGDRLDLPTLAPGAYMLLLEDEQPFRFVVAQ